MTIVDVKAKDEKGTAYLIEIQLAVLNRELGAVATVRFLQQFELGQGDYTKERHEWLKDITVNGITKEIKQKRTSR